MGLIALVLGALTAGYEAVRWHNDTSFKKTLTYEEAQIENAHTALGFAGLFFALAGSLVTYATSSNPGTRSTPYREKIGA
jgi:hypothetical protein